MDTTRQPQKKEAPQSRQQRRLIERIENEARATHERLAQRFMDFFINHDDPEGEAVQDKIRQISAQWRLYCASKRLTPESYVSMDTFMDAVLKQYQATKDNAASPPRGDNETK